jgi:hypothetical protein
MTQGMGCAYQSVAHLFLLPHPDSPCGQGQTVVSATEYEQSLVSNIFGNALRYQGFPPMRYLPSAQSVMIDLRTATWVSMLKLPGLSKSELRHDYGIEDASVCVLRQLSELL